MASHEHLPFMRRAARHLGVAPSAIEDVLKEVFLVATVTLLVAACGGSVVAPESSSSSGSSFGSSGTSGFSSSSSSASGGSTSASSGTSGGADAGGDAVDEETVVEPDGATVTGVAYGNPTKFPTCIAGNGMIQAGYLFAVPVDLPSTGTVQGLGLITEQRAVATMALYALAPVGELSLVTQTASTTIAAGSNVIPTPPTALPGTGPSYWIAVEFKETTTVCAHGWGAEVQFGKEPYGTFPSIWSATAITTASPLNVFVVIN
jgi:hypothetical protein